MDDRTFEALEDEMDRLAAENEPRLAAVEEAAPRLDAQSGRDPAQDKFERLVVDAIDELPGEVQRELHDVAIVVSDDGHERNWYGTYIGRKFGHDTRIGVADFYLPPDQIVIFRDTLVRDFGHDPALLRAKVIETVRHEVGHHLGFDEHGVRRLGL